MRARNPAWVDRVGHLSSGVVERAEAVEERTAFRMPAVVPVDQPRPRPREFGAARRDLREERRPLGFGQHGNMEAHGGCVRPARGVEEGIAPDERSGRVDDQHGTQVGDPVGHEDIAGADGPPHRPSDIARETADPGGHPVGDRLTDDLRHGLDGLPPFVQGIETAVDAAERDLLGDEAGSGSGQTPDRARQRLGPRTKVGESRIAVLGDVTGLQPRQMLVEIAQGGPDVLQRRGALLVDRGIVRCQHLGPKLLAKHRPPGRRERPGQRGASAPGGDDLLPRAQVPAFGQVVANRRFIRVGEGRQFPHRRTAQPEQAALDLEVLAHVTGKPGVGPILSGSGRKYQPS